MAPDRPERPPPLRERLDELDRRWVPRLATAARRATDRATASADAVRRRDLRSEARAALRRADAAAAARLPGRAPSRLVSTSLAAVLLAGAAALAVVRDGEQEAREEALRAAATATPSPAQSEAGPYSQAEQDLRTVGPQLGSTVDAYLTLTRAEVRLAAATGPDNTGTALVSLAAYATPAQAAEVARGLTPVRALARVPETGAQTSQLTAVTRVLPEDLVSAYDERAVRKDGEAQALADAADRFPVGSPERRRSEEAARVARAEAAAYRARCACVYALVLQGPVGVLAALATDPRVRAVDLAPAGRPVDELIFRGLLPEQTETVGPPG